MTTAPRTQFLVQLLQKLGAPLMAAVGSHSAGGDSSEKDAQTLSSLLSESVKISISLSQAMNLKPEDGDADAIRVALAALAGELVADSYRQTGRLPTENDSRRIAKALESVIVFADNFAPAAEHAKRLETLESTPPFMDPVQTNIYAIHSLAPAISAISEFAFGQVDTRLVQDVAERLRARAKELLGTLGGEGSAMAELVVLQALGHLYAGAHRAETKRLKDKGEDASASLDPVWAAFDKQTAMLAVLLAPASGAGQASGGGGGVKPAVEPPAQEAPPPAAPPPAQEPSAPPPATPPAGGNPMSFFKKK